MTSKKPANTARTERKKTIPKSAWKKGQSGNLKGAPKRGQSWQEIYNRIGNMTPIEAAEYCKSIASQLTTIGGSVTLKEATVLRVFVALLFEPNARLLNAVMDRDEGKVPNVHEIIDWRAEAHKAGYDPEELYNRLVAAGRAAVDASGDRRSGPDGHSDSGPAVEADPADAPPETD